MRERLGEPTSVRYPQAAGCLDEDYGTVHVATCQGAVTHVSADECP